MRARYAQPVRKYEENARKATIGHRTWKERTEGFGRNAIRTRRRKKRRRTALQRVPLRGFFGNLPGLVLVNDSREIAKKFEKMASSQGKRKVQETVFFKLFLYT